MALPVTISSVIVGQQNSYHGPVKSSGAAFYTALLDSTSNNLVELHKATDPTSSFSEVDGTNRPDFVADVLSLNIFQDSDDLHVVGQNSSDDVYYARGVLGSDAWADIDGAGAEAILVDDAPNGTADACDIAVLSAAYGVGSAFVKIRVVYQGETDMDMGDPFERIDESNSVDDGATWSAPTSIDSATGGAGVHYTGPRIVLPPSNSDQCHIFFSAGGILSQRAIAGDDTLQTYRDTGFFARLAIDYPIGHSIGFIRSSTSKVRVCFKGNSPTDPLALEFDAFSDDTDRTEASSTISTDSVGDINGSVNICFAADGSIIRGLVEELVSHDLFEFFDDDADSYTVQGTAHVIGTANHISCNVYDRSGTKLAMIYDDGGTVKYDEISLAAFDPDVDAFRFYDDGTESGSSPKADQDIDIELDATGDAQFHLRYLIQNIGAGDGETTDDYALEVSKNSGSFAAITGASSDVQSDTASGLTADAATTNRGTNGITDGTGSFVAGEQEETNGVIENHQLTASNFTEHVWACKLIDADLGDGDTLDFRITLNGGAPGITNSVLPRITTPTVGPPLGTLALTGVGI